MGTGDENESSLLRNLTGLQDSASLAGFLEVAFDAVVTFNSEERITSWNPAAEQMFGWTSQEALGKTPSELFWPVDLPLEQEYKEQRQARLRRGETLRGETTPCRKDGSTFPIQFTVRALFDGNRKLTGYLAVYRDISAQVQAREKEEQLKQSNQKLNEILTSIQDDFYVLDRNWVFVFTSNSFTSKIGKEPKDFVGNNIWEMFPKHLGTILEENFRAAMEKREIRRFEIPGKYTDAWYRMTAFPSAEGITVIGTDITDRKRIEKALQLENERFMHFFNSNIVGILIGKPDGKVILANDYYLRLLGVTRQDFNEEKVDWRKFTPPEWLYKDEKAIQELWEHGVCEPYEKEYVRADGTRVPVYLADAMLSGPGEEIVAFALDITERKLAEQALQESEERYRHLVKYAPTAIYEIDLETMHFTEVNDSMCEILGYTREELLSLPPEELLDEESRERFTNRIAQTFTEGKIPEQIEYKVRTKDGRELWSVLNTMITSERGKPKNVSVIAHDITERKMAELALRESEERYRTIIEGMHEGIWMLDLNGVTTYVNAQMAALLGYTPKEMIGRDAFDFVINDDITRGQKEWHDRRSEQGGRQSEYRYRHKDGHAVWCLVNSSNIQDGQGKNLGILGMVSDISERRRSEELLRQQAQLLNLSGEAIFIWEFDGVIDYWNHGAERLYGYNNQEAIGRISHELLATQHPSEIQDFMAALERVGEWRGEVIHRTKDGRNVIVESSQQLIQQDDRRLVLETNRDITARKQAEDALRESERQLQLLNESLEQRVREKTEEVRRLAADLVKAVQRERHRISHILHDDLQQRIYAIQVQLTFLQSELQRVNETAQKETTDIEKQLAEVLEITRNLSIDLSPPILRDEGLSHAIHWLANQMRQRYGLPINVQADEPFAIPDEELHVFLFNCVREFLFNVVKHAGATRAVVALQWMDDDLQIEVGDDGKGFRANDSEAAMSLEMNGEDGLQSSYGLPTIRHQLSLFDGRMEIKSELGKGTQVTLIVPVSGRGQSPE